MECFYCARVFDNNVLTDDHVLPKSLGGRRNYWNIVRACRKCNNRKANQTLAELSAKVATDLGASGFVFKNVLAWQWGLASASATNPDWDKLFVLNACQSVSALLDLQSAERQTA